MQNGFQGKDGQTIPEMTPEIIESISKRYIELYEHITGHDFQPAKSQGARERIEEAILANI